MKKWIVTLGISLALGIGLVLVGCSSSVPVKTGSDTEDQPDWVQSMGRYDKGEGAVGSSPKSNLGTQVQREDAMLAARNELAKNIETKIQSVVSQTRQRLLEQGIAGASELGSLQTQNVIRGLVNLKLKKSRPIKQWKDPESDELYVWVVIEQADLDQMGEDVQNKTVRKTLKEASDEHKKTIKETFNKEFQKQFAN